MNKAFPDKLRETALVTLLCIIVIAAVFYPAVFQGKLIFLEDGRGSDSLDHNIIRRHLAVQSIIKYGEFPLWEPKIGCGAPLFAESEAGVLYPTILFYFLKDLTLATNLTVLSAVLIAMLGSYLWCRCLGLEPPASGVGALAYGLSYSFLLRTGQLNIIHVIAWLPASLAAIYLGITTARKRYVFLLAVIWTAQLLVSHFQMAAICQICCWLYICWLIFTQANQRMIDRFKRLGMFICALMFAASLAAVQLLPTRELAYQSTRSTAVSLDSLEKIAARWNMLAVFVNPFYLEFSDDPNEKAPHNKTCFYAREWFHYIGIIPFLLCFCAFAAPRKRLALGFLFQAGFFLIASMGPTYGIYYIIWRFLPYFNSFRSPGRFAIPLTCIMAILAAIGLQNLLDYSKARYGKRRCQTAVCIILVLICADFIYVNSQVQGYLPNNWQEKPRTLELINSPQRIYSPYSGTSWKNYLEYTYQEPDRRYDTYWQHRALLGTNLSSIWAIESPEDYLSHAGGIVLEHSYIQQISLYYIMNSIHSLNEREIAFIAPKLCTWLRLIGISHIVTPMPLPAEWPSEEFADKSSVVITELPGAKAYIYTIAKPLKKIRLVKALQKGMPADALDLGKLVHYQDTDGLYESDFTASGGLGQAELETASNHSIIIKTSCPKDAYLIINNTFDPNWKAWVDNMPVTIQRTNLSLQSLPVPKGKHRIELRYISPAFELGLKISLATLAAFFVTAVLTLRAEKNRQQR